MNNRLKETFDNIHAEEDLKRNTRAFLDQKTQGYQRHGRSTFARKSLIPVTVCCLFLFIGLGGGHMYFTPASVISIDINPSMELGVNRFDRVISIEGFNPDGDRLADSLDVRFLNYVEALEQILDNDDIEAYLSRDAMLSIAVIGSDEARNAQMLSHIESCTSGHENTHCSSADSKGLEGAHASGLSCGKYRAFLELKALDPGITVEKVQGMTMKEIRDLIDVLSSDAPAGTPDDGDAGSDMGHDTDRDYNNGHSGGHNRKGMKHGR